MVTDMSLLYDVLRGGVDCPDLVVALNFSVPSRRTRHTPMLSVPAHSTNYASNNVLARIARVYNNNFNHIDPFICSKYTFKQLITKSILSSR